MDPYASDPRRQCAATCPRCGHDAHAGTGARSICTACGHEWQVGAAEHLPAAQDAHPDDLGVAAEPLARIRGFLDGPPAQAERARASRFLDSLADRRADLR